MEKQEIHRKSFIVSQLVTFLDLILRGDDLFVSSIKEERFGSIDVFENRYKSGGFRLVIKPKWWPKEGRVVLHYALQTNGDWLEFSIFLEMPHIWKLRNRGVDLERQAHFPFLKPRTPVVVDFNNPADTEVFRKLCEKVHAQRT